MKGTKIKVKDLKEQRIIKDLELLGEVKSNCIYCGKDKVISISLQEIECEDKSCIGKVLEESSRILSYLGVNIDKGVKKRNHIRKVLEEGGIQSGLGVLNNMGKVCRFESEEDMECIKESYRKLLKTSLDYIVSKVGIKGLNGVEGRLFKEGEDIGGFYKEYKKDKERCIKERIGLKEEEECKEVYEIIEELDRIEGDIKELSRKVSVRGSKREVVRVVCIGEVKSGRYEGDKRIKLESTLPDEWEEVYVIVKEGVKELLEKYKGVVEIRNFNYITEGELEEILKERDKDNGNERERRK